MHITQQQEQFSRAYIHTIASVAGFTIYTPLVDDDSVDLGIAQKGGRGTIRSPRLEMQLKCTYSHKLVSEQFTSLQLSLEAQKL